LLVGRSPKLSPTCPTNPTCYRRNLLEAEHSKASKAVFVVHEFRTAKTVDTKLEANADGLNRFLRVFVSANGADTGDNFELRCCDIVASR